MLQHFIEQAHYLAILVALRVISGGIGQGRERKVRPFSTLSFTAPCFVAFLLTFCLPAAAGIPAPKTATRESVRVVMDDNYPPYTFRDSSGTLQGILVDQWALWAKKTGISVRLDAMDWAEAQQRMEAGDYDVIDTLFVNEHRKALYDFSAPYANIDVPLFFSRELSGIRGPKDLAGFVVGAKKGDSSIEILKASGVVNFLFFDNYEAIVAAARDGRIKVFTIDKPPALYFLIRMGIQDQFRESKPLYSGEFHRAVRKGNTALLEDVQQGFNAISKGEYEGIDRHWYGAPILSKERLTLVAFIAGGAIVIVGLLMLWVWLLRRSVRQRMAELQKDIAERELTEATLRESDITGRKQAQLLLTASEEKYRTLVDNLSLGIVVHQPDTSVLFSNPIASTILGLSKEQMSGKIAMDPCWRFIKEDGSTLPPEGYPVVRMITSGESIHSQILGICRPDLTEPVWVLCDGYPVKDEQGIFLQAVISFVDITERKQAEAKVLHLNEELEQRVKDRTAQLEAANQELEAFSYSVSHDLRAPLRGIDGFSQALVEDYQERLDETGRSYISRIRAGSQRMGQLIDDILKLSRVSRRELTPVKTELSDLCRKIMGELTIAAPERRIEVSIQLDMSAWADPDLLHVAMENLLRNAWKFTSKREEPRIEVGEMASPSGEPTFFIRDNGAGFDMAHADKLFNAFQRLHSTNEFEGTGIGLSIVQRIIHRHGGRIWAEAEPGKGAAFFFTLPERGEA